MAPIQKTPLVAAPPRLFYGWYIVLVAFLGFFMSTGVSLYAFGVLIKPMSEDLGWSRSTLLAANTLATVTGALVSPWVGKLVDRHGTRFITALSAFMVGATFLPIGWVQSVWQFHLLYGVSNGMFRPGMSALSGPTAVANWFVRKRGRAMGWVATGVSMGGLLLVPLTQWIVGQWGWRTAWMALGLLTWVMMIAPALLILRRRPEDMGLLPDGDPPRPPQVRAGGAPAAAQEEPGWTAAAALRTRAFWLVLIAWSLSGMGTSSFFLLQTSYYGDKGLSPTAAAAATSVFAFTTLWVKFPWGVITERTHIRNACIIYFTLSALGAVTQLFVADVPTAVLAAFMYGIPAGGSVQLSSQVWADYFGRQALGAIRGYSTLFQVGAQAGGPLFAAGVYDATGSYTMAFGLFAVTFLAAAGLMFLAVPPKAPLTAVA